MFFTQVKTGSPIFGFILVFLLMAISVLAACNSEKPSHQDAIRQFTECFERFDDISVDAIEYYNGMDASGKGGGESVQSYRKGQHHDKTKCSPVRSSRWR